MWPLLLVVRCVWSAGVVGSCNACGVHVVVECGDGQPLPNFRMPMLPDRPDGLTDQHIEEAIASEFTRHDTELLALSEPEDLPAFCSV